MKTSRNGGLHDIVGSADEHPSSDPPTLPPLPPTDTFDCAFPGDRSTPPSLLTIPTEIRQLIFDTIVPHGALITLRIHSHTTLLKHLYNLSQTCRALHGEITNYLTTRPLTILCSQFLSPNIMNGIPPRVLARVETLAIEDSPATEPNWALLRNISTICFTDIYDLLIHPTPSPPPLSNPGPSTSTPTATTTTPLHPHPSVTPSTQTIIPTYPPTTASLPTNNTVLAHAHRYWQTLRLEHAWIRALWKRDAAPYDALPHVRVLLRRVFEARVASLDGGDAAGRADKGHENGGGDGGGVAVFVAWHGVVDVDSRKVLENRYLATRVQGGRGDGGGDDDDEYVFPYGAQTWWRKGIVDKGQDV